MNRTARVGRMLSANAEGEHTQVPLLQRSQTITQRGLLHSNTSPRCR